MSEERSKKTEVRGQKTEVRCETQKVIGKDRHGDGERNKASYQ